ncbi:MAG: glycosyltransferase, partial [Ignavibacteriales bacterium]|nr:glycosyltransferase [Ignavibacteriales bacterium]
MNAHFWAALALLAPAAFYVWFATRARRGVFVVERDRRRSDETPFVSVVVPFRNETENILVHLACMKSQTYPADRFELIYVDDASDDDSREKLERAEKPASFRVFSSPESDAPNAHKKRAVRFGVRQARGEIILGSDADCRYGERWIETMVERFAPEVGFVSGPVAFEPNERLFERTQAIEFASLTILGAGMIGARRAFTCNAANMAYRVATFEEVGGFEDNLELSSGDDEFLMQKIAARNPAAVAHCYDRRALCRTDPNKTLRQFLHQRRRWGSKSLRYRSKTLVAQLVGVFFFMLGLPVQLALGAFLSPWYFASFGASFLAKIIVEWASVKKGEGIFLEKLRLGDFLLTQT